LYQAIPDSGQVTHEDYWKRVAALRLGVLPEQLLWDYSLAAVFLRGQGAAAGGVRTFEEHATGLPVQRVSSGGGGGGTSVIGQSASSNVQKTFKTSATSKWWYAAEFALNTTVGAATVLGVGGTNSTAVDSTRTILLGGDGATSTANFCLFGSAGAAMNFGASFPLDTNMYQWEVLRDGSSTQVFRNNSFVASGTARPGADSRFFAIAFDTAAVTQSLDIVFWACARPRISA
jgi:hypothetical protein